MFFPTALASTRSSTGGKTCCGLFRRLSGTMLQHAVCIAIARWACCEAISLQGCLPPKPTLLCWHGATCRSLSAQVSCLASAWQWSPSDTILHALPLHHVHGIINALYCAHAVGAAVNFLPKFSPAAVWQQLMVRGGAAQGAFHWQHRA